MIYKFKSQATGELIMLEPTAKQVLGILGKDASGSGTITVEQIPAAIAAIENAVSAEEASQKQLIDEAKAKGEPKPQFAPIGLRSRTITFIDMLKRSAAEKEPITW